ncbi:MAG: hypothetical protein ACRELY_08320 [Polyangiaceae bacterium]
MRNLRRTAAILLGILGVTGGAAVIVVGCGGDDTIIGTGGPDSGSDVTADVIGNDTGISDSGADAFHFDAGPITLDSFYHQIDVTACAWEQNCCGGSTVFDTTACLRDLDDPTSAGFMFTRTLQAPADAGSTVVFDDAKAAECLNLIQGLSCSEDPSAITAAQSQAIRTACYGAITGTIPAGNPGCTDSIECEPNNHCEFGPDGGGTCVAPYTLGTPCVLNGELPPTSLYRCGRAFAGQPNYCQTCQFYTIEEAGTCSPPQDVDASCYTPYECASWVCDFNSERCANSFAIINTGLCTAYPPDGG